MLTLVAIGALGGLIAGLSPCVLPVLPAILASTVSPEGVRRRPVLVVGGLILSFSVTLLLGSALLSALGLPSSTLTDIGVAALGVVGLSLVWPAFGHLLERPFAAAGQLGPQGKKGSGFVLGLSLGLVFVPCAGPVLAAVTTLAAAGHLGAGTIELTIGYAVGVAVPLLGFALLGERFGKAFRLQAPRARTGAGAVLLASAVLIGSGALAPLQRSLPGYTSALQSSLENSGSVRSQLRSITSAGNASAGCFNALDQQGGLSQTGCRAPDFVGISHWLNSAPLSLASLHGRVVLIDFWTYSCINCQRTLPHLRTIYSRFKDKGLTIVGVHTPEFAFEHDVGNIRSAARDLQVSWPIAVDNGYGTWNAYSNEYWPAEYLIDQTGIVRHVHFGEGGYAETSRLVAQLLHTSASAVSDGPQNDQPQTPESYLGTQRAQNVVNEPGAAGTSRTFQLPSDQAPDTLAYGGQWTVGSEYAESGRAAVLRLRFQASKVYLVLGGAGTISLTLDGRELSPVRVSGVPTLYTLYAGAQQNGAILELHLSPGISAYDFTFG